MNLAMLATIMDVSPSTVSKALLGRPGVSDILRNKIKSVALELGIQAQWQQQQARKQRLRFSRTSGPQLFLPLQPPIRSKLR